MTREEEDRRLALSQWLAAIWAALSAIPDVADYRVSEHLASARVGLERASKVLADELAGLKKKAIDETPEEDR